MSYRLSYVLIIALYVLCAGCGSINPVREEGTPKAEPSAVETLPSPYVPPAPTPPTASSPTHIENIPLVPPSMNDNLPSAPMPAPLPQAKPAEPMSNSVAVMALYTRAMNQERAGQPLRAVATLERALRIEPRNASLWYRLARVHMALGEWQTAANLAARSEAYAGSDAELRSANLALISEAKQRLGKP